MVINLMLIKKRVGEIAAVHFVYVPIAGRSEGVGETIQLFWPILNKSDIRCD